MPPRFVLYQSMTASAASMSWDRLESDRGDVVSAHQDSPAAGSHGLDMARKRIQLGKEKHRRESRPANLQSKGNIPAFSAVFCLRLREGRGGFLKKSPAPQKLLSRCFRICGAVRSFLGRDTLEKFTKVYFIDLLQNYKIRNFDIAST